MFQPGAAQQGGHVDPGEERPPRKQGPTAQGIRPGMDKVTGLQNFFLDQEAFRRRSQALHRPGKILEPYRQVCQIYMVLLLLLAQATAEILIITVLEIARSETSVQDEKLDERAVCRQRSFPGREPDPAEPKTVDLPGHVSPAIPGAFPQYL